jgi:tyrosine-protein phosphatase
MNRTHSNSTAGEHYRRVQTLAAPPRPFLIRSTASTPNLQASFATPDASTSTVASAYPSLPTTVTVIPSGIQRFPPDSRTGRPGLEYLHLPWGHDEDNLVARFPTAFAFLDRARAAGGRVLVHCQCGVSRSATAAIAYVMRDAARGGNGLEGVKGMHEAYQWVKDRSGCVAFRWLCS